MAKNKRVDVLKLAGTFLLAGYYGKPFTRQEMKRVGDLCFLAIPVKERLERDEWAKLVGGGAEICPKCGSADVNPPDEGAWPDCNDCGFVQYDGETLRLQAEVRGEMKTAKQIFGRIPTYSEWVEYQKTGKVEDL